MTMALPATFRPGEAMASTFVVDEICTLFELEALRSAWDRLAGTAAEPMQTHAWTLAAVHTLHGNARLRIIVVRRGAALAAVAPLVEVVRGGRRWLELAGSFHLYEPVRMLADSDEAREILCRAIAAQRVPIRMQRLDAGAWPDALRAAGRGRALVIEAPSCPCLRVELGSFEATASSLSSERAATVRRKRRQLEKLGVVALESVEPGPENVELVLREAFEVEARSWKGAAGSAVLQQPALFAFFCELGRHYAAGGALLIRRLRVGSEIAAVHVGVVVEHCCYELKIGYDEKFARQSPGVLLTLDCLRDSTGRGLRAHEFLGCAAAWQEPFASIERPLRNLVIYPLSARGLTAFALDGAGVAARRAFRLARGPWTLAVRVPRELAGIARQRLSAARGRWFDWRNRVDTDTRIAVADLPDIDTRLARHAVHYEATSIPKFERALRVVGDRADGFTFVDLGSGKGRVLMLAARLPFRRVIGVEISQRLHAAAVSNVTAFKARHRSAVSIECLCADASTYELPEGDLVVFLYNPFDAALLAQARDRMLAACARSARTLCVIYVNPLHHSLFENDEFTCDHRDSSFAVYWCRARAGAKT
jgi:CelD/BcsL family acetyltransferase involved in cellulose biosynthesis/SAM-dependent methyltransferase